MHSYWNQPENTAQTYVDGWFRTGDIMEVDQDGDYWFVGRKKHIIVFNGSNIYPQEVENVIHEYPGIEQVVVVPRNDEENGQIPIACIQLISGQLIDEQALNKFLQERLADYKIPKHYCYMKAIPLTTMGKNR